MTPSSYSWAPHHERLPRRVSLGSLTVVAPCFQAGILGFPDALEVAVVPIINPTLREMQQELSVGEEFVNRYNRPGPRYTSYPTAPVWVDTFGPAEYEAAIEEADRKASPVSLYMHLPFCESLCLFCACNVIIQKDKRVTPPYLSTLKKEIDRIAHGVSRNRPVTQFHWGGGTPTYLSPEQIEDLFTYTRERFTFAPDSEIGIEIDPRVTTRDHLETLRRMGFNRLSMGIQDFKEEVQKAVHRVQPYELTRDLIAIARELGFDSINVDLIYGLPLPNRRELCPHRRTDRRPLPRSHRHVQLCPRSLA